MFLGTSKLDTFENIHFFLFVYCALNIFKCFLTHLNNFYTFAIELSLEKESHSIIKTEITFFFFNKSKDNIHFFFSFVYYALNIFKCFLTHLNNFYTFAIELSLEKESHSIIKTKITFFVSVNLKTIFIFPLRLVLTI